MAKKEKKGGKGKGRTIEVFTVSAAPRATATKLAPLGVQVSEVDVSELTGNLQNVLSEFQDALTELPAGKSGFAVDAVALNLTVGAKGKIGLIASAEVSASAAITVTLKRQTRP